MCDYCCNGKVLGESKDRLQGVDAEISGYELEISGWYDSSVALATLFIPINYCPMCGRDLRGGERPMRTLYDESPVTVPYGLAHMMVICAVRYYMGRHTIAAHAVADGIAKLFPQLAESTRGVLERDLRRWLDENPTCEFGCVDDREPWARLLEAIEEEQC